MWLTELFDNMKMTYLNNTKAFPKIFVKKSMEEIFTPNLLPVYTPLPLRLICRSQTNVQQSRRLL